MFFGLTSFFLILSQQTNDPIFNNNKLLLKAKIVIQFLETIEALIESQRKTLFIVSNSMWRFINSNQNNFLVMNEPQLKYYFGFFAGSLKSSLPFETHYILLL